MLWENQIRRIRDRQNLYVIWILGRFGNEVKQEIRHSKNTSQVNETKELSGTELRLSKG